ncbi:hypothetical protein GAY33_18245 [Azospirillum brasilense]|uniref:hypothetical protein n=1 Tax=Azospirillum argentinense TaxID=2970906 RepID=UPI00190E5F3C|nr:hypothetical protein [Azospirillum argentinense]MBK3801141.1 hypothetical protein [Azospirillum argentinense]
MEEFRSIIERLPQRELDIRRRYGCDAQFRTVCADYEEATTAIRHWRSLAEQAGKKAEEYTGILQELEAEVLNRLGHPPPQG